MPIKVAGVLVCLTSAIVAALLCAPTASAQSLPLGSMSTPQSAVEQDMAGTTLNPTQKPACVGFARD